MAATVVAAVTRAKAMAFEEQWVSHQPFRLFSQTAWAPPPPDWLKINVDGSLINPDQASVAAIVRDEHGNFVAALGKQVRHTDIAMVELMAATCFSDIVEPWMVECKGVIVEGDNLGVIQLLQRTLHKMFWQGRPPDAPDIAFLSQFHNVIFNHVPRTLNRVADFCSKFAHLGDFCWASRETALLPPLLVSLLEEDRARLA